MDEKGLAVPDYLRDCLKRAERKMISICNGASDPSPAPGDKNKKDVKVERPQSMKIVSKDVVKAPKQDVKRDSTHSGGADPSMSNVKIPRKGSIGKNAPSQPDKGNQKPLVASTTSAIKTKKLNLTSVLVMMGSTKETTEVTKARQKVEPIPRTNSSNEQNSNGSGNKFSNFARHDDRKAPPLHQQYSGHQLLTWESSNMCGWGDVQEVIKKSSSSTKTLLTVAEANKSTKD